MNPWTILKVSVTCGALAGALIYICKRNLPTILHEARGASASSNVFHHVLFFPDKGFVCKYYAWAEKGCLYREECQYLHEETSFKKLGDFLHSAKHTLDVCVYTISSSILCDMLIETKKRGVLVRIITDDESDHYRGSQMGRFRENGIPLRTDNSSFLMHHKFVVVDGRTLINGSFNWTRQAITANNENVIITNNVEIVRPFVSQFKFLWEKFDPLSRP